MIPEKPEKSKISDEMNALFDPFFGDFPGPGGVWRGGSNGRLHT